MFLLPLVAHVGFHARPMQAQGFGWLERLGAAVADRCVTAEAGRALSEVVASGALAPILGDELTLVRGDVRANQIEVEVRERAQRAYVVTLVTSGAAAGPVAGRGRNFDFVLAPAPDDPRTRAALLAIATAFDAAIPDRALARCTGGGESQADPRYPLPLILFSAVAQILVIAAAVVFGLRALSVKRET
jgi:hypothetical protein